MTVVGRHMSGATTGYGPESGAHSSGLIRFATAAIALHLPPTTSSRSKKPQNCAFYGQIWRHYAGIAMKNTTEG